MLDQETKAAILRLKREKHGKKTIARVLGISKISVNKVLAAGQTEVEPALRQESLSPQLDLIRSLYADCKGNTIRVAEELEALKIPVAYSTLTGFCRRHGISTTPKKAAGQYCFDPGEEMQHDTSPHKVTVNQKKHTLQCASLVLCYSRMIYAQAFPAFNRFAAKIFLTDAIKYFEGSAGRCMIDNTSVMVAHGSGPDAVIAPEMEAFSERFSFTFTAHHIGDANRSARVERPFHYIENNFYPGRQFGDLNDLNQQMLAWCDKVNHSCKRHLKASPIELFAKERAYLRPLPIYIPEVYAHHVRIVDIEGYVNLHANRYSVPEDLIGRKLEVHETKSSIIIHYNHNTVCKHERCEPGLGLRKTLPQHRNTISKHTTPFPITDEEVTLKAAGEEFSDLINSLKKTHSGRGIRAIRKLHRFYLDYPTKPLKKVISHALAYGLTDLDRIERMVLRCLADEFFRLPLKNKDGGFEDD